MTKIEVLEWDYGSVLIEVKETVSFKCLSGPATALIEVRYVPICHILEFVSFRNWLKTEPELKEGIVEEIASRIYKKLMQALWPAELEVVARVGGNVFESDLSKHGPTMVQIGKVNYQG